MTSHIAWLDASAEDQRRMREIVRLFSQQESRDELGIGQIRDALSDALFPGTSTLHTRARYMLFIPWCFREAASRSRDTTSLNSMADKMERSLISGLRAAGEQGADVDGLLGSAVGEALKTLPSSVYWSALRQYGILAEGNLDLEDVLSSELARRIHRGAPVEEGEPAAWHVGAWTIRLPPVPEGFPREVPDGFSLTAPEAGWLKERMLLGAAGTALAHVLIVRPTGDSTTPWADPAMQSLSGQPRVLLEHARRFSTALYGAALLYNVLLADAYAERGFDRAAADAAKHRPALERWGAEVSGLDAFDDWDLDDFWALIGRANPRVASASRAFVTAWVRLIQTSDPSSMADDAKAREFIANRERLQKRSQARLRNEKLLSGWSGASGSGRLVFRWGSVRRIVADIHEGLERSDA